MARILDSLLGYIRRSVDVEFISSGLAVGGVVGLVDRLQAFVRGQPSTLQIDFSLHFALEVFFVFTWAFSGKLLSLAFWRTRQQTFVDRWFAKPLGSLGRDAASFAMGLFAVAGVVLCFDVRFMATLLLIFFATLVLQVPEEAMQGPVERWQPSLFRTVAGFAIVFLLVAGVGGLILAEPSHKP